ncbi:MAG: adenine phosphoribosyltransferase [Moraxella sp.]|nr:adenine phosphoribosyltransferase [Moraxella sp.]
MISTHPFWQIIRTVPNFPKAGIDFYDITPLLNGHIKTLVDELLSAVPTEVLNQVDTFAAVEARGFIFASLLAERTGKNMLLIRKAGKLPPPTHQESYGLEYGKDTLEIRADIKPANVLLIDDVLATGGTLTASVNLCQKAGHTVLGALVLLDLHTLHGALPVPTFSVLKA